MYSHEEETYGERIAGINDQRYAEYDHAAIGALKELAQGGRALDVTALAGDLTQSISGVCKLRGLLQNCSLWSPSQTTYAEEFC
ncbi:hypothetical protein ACFLWA_07165 [Chloroflexota bacterium]